MIIRCLWFIIGFLGALRSLAATVPALPPVLLEGWPLRLTCEHRENPLGVDRAQPRLSWWVGENAPDAIQTAYQIRVARTPEKLAAPDLWDSGRVASAQSVDVAYGGAPLLSETHCFWQVRTWNRAGKPSDWSEVNWWEMGLLRPTDWQAKWIGAPARDTSKSAPAVYLRKEIVLTKKVRSARLYATARGLFVPQLNGERVGEDHFTPGWTDYAKRNQYLVYDLTHKLTGGLNVVGVILGDGWHNGYLKLIHGFKKNWYGEDTSLLAQLVVRYEDGTREVFGTDGTWQVSEGPIVESDLYNGETYDARRELEHGGWLWDAPGFQAKNWRPARVVPASPARLVAKVNRPVRAVEVLAPVSVTRRGDEWMFDFGQNLTGWVRFKLRGRGGETLTLRFAEMLNPDGSLHTGNLRDARATDRYTFAEDGLGVWHPTFTYHGFRYATIAGLDDPPPAGSVEAVVLHNDMAPTGHFETSNARVNALQSAIRWSQRDNAFDVPTDCPQRDERLGWTGDANFFLPTATFNYDEAAMIEKWMGDLVDAQTADGRFTVYAPAADDAGDAAAYSDGGVICPWVIYERYGDAQILADNFAAMQAWIEFQRRTSKDLIRPATGYGDWLAPVKPGEPKRETLRDLIGTAYFAHTTDLTARAAEVLGKKENRDKLRALHRDIVTAFRRQYVDGQGRLTNDTQAAYALALEFELLPETVRTAALKHLVDDIRAHDWRMATGFVGTPMLMRVLQRFGEDDTAYRLLLSREYPGWLYMIDQGATTIWERWNSFTPETGFGDKIADTGFGDVAMNSFNHTVWGAVGEWMYGVIGGIEPAKPGFQRIRIRARPGGDLTWAKTELDSPYGRIATDWKQNDAGGVLNVSIPPNTRADVILPDGQRKEVGAGRHTFALPPRR